MAFLILSLLIEFDRKSDAKQFNEKFPQAALREAWGMTELSPLGLCTPKNKIKIGSAGIAIPNSKLKIVDVETGDPLGPGQTGELCISGPMVMKGYLNNKEATDHTIRGGWAGVDVVALAEKLQIDGRDSFDQAWKAMIADIGSKADSIANG